jgi:nucleotide-binding universal stress UspA family protein
MPAREIEAMQESRGGDAMESARAMLDAAGITYVPEVALGEIAETIVRRLPAKPRCDAIILGTHGMGIDLRSALTGST